MRERTYDPAYYNSFAPCPFCGTVSFYPKECRDRNGRVAYACVGCEARGPWAYTQTNARDNWNLQSVRIEEIELDTGYDNGIIEGKREMWSTIQQAMEDIEP